MPLFHFHSYLRAAVELPVELKGLGVSPIPGKISRLSEEGAIFTSDQKLSVSNSVTFALILTPEAGQINVEGDILWNRPVVTEGRRQFAHGLLFSRLGVQDRERLVAFIENSMNY